MWTTSRRIQIQKTGTDHNHLIKRIRSFSGSPRRSICRTEFINRNPHSVCLALPREDAAEAANNLHPSASSALACRQGAVFAPPQEPHGDSLVRSPQGDKLIAEADHTVRGPLALLHHNHRAIRIVPKLQGSATLSVPHSTHFNIRQSARPKALSPEP